MENLEEPSSSISLRASRVRSSHMLTKRPTPIKSDVKFILVTKTKGPLKHQVKIDDK